MNIDNPKAREFIYWVRELHDEETAEQCRWKLLLSKAEDFVPIDVLNDVLYEMHKDEIEAADAQGDVPFDSDDPPTVTADSRDYLVLCQHAASIHNDQPSALVKAARQGDI